MPKAADLVGERFGRLVVKYQDGKIYGGCVAWHCECDCGGRTRASTSCLRSGNTTSCGCSRTRNGRAHHPLYKRWRSMWDRCTNPNVINYDDYGGRKITVCDRWRSFETFVKDVGFPPGPGMQLDRIENDKGYEPGNTRWNTPLGNSRNRRNTVRLELDGVRKPLTQWCQELGLDYQRVYRRLKTKGMTDPAKILAPTPRLRKSPRHLAVDAPPLSW